jgi:hypothetical protein
VNQLIFELLKGVQKAQPVSVYKLFSYRHYKSINSLYKYLKIYIISRNRGYYLIGKLIASFIPIPGSALTTPNPGFLQNVGIDAVDYVSKAVDEDDI